MLTSTQHGQGQEEEEGRWRRGDHVYQREKQGLQQEGEQKSVPHCGWPTNEN
jgi:hypothetical protein